MLCNSLFMLDSAVSLARACEYIKHIRSHDNFKRGKGETKGNGWEDEKDTS